MSQLDELDAKLDPYRSGDGFETYRPVISAQNLLNDAKLLSVVSAWPSVARKEWTRPREAEPIGPSFEHWRWLWRGVTVDEEALAAASGLQPIVAAEKLRQAIALASIFPDGSLATWAQALIKAKVKEALVELIPQTRKEAKP